MFSNLSRSRRAGPGLVLWVALVASGPESSASLPGALERLPADAHAVLVVDWTRQDEDGVLAALQQQLLGDFQKPLDDFLFLSGVSLEEEADQLVLARLPVDDGEKTGVVGVLQGRFAESTRASLSLSRDLMAERDYRVRLLDEARVAFGDSQALERLLDPDGDDASLLGTPRLAESREDLRVSPVWSMMTGEWFGKPPEGPTDSALRPWSLTGTLRTVRSQLVWCRPGSEVEARLTVRLANEQDADLLVDELETYRGLRFLPREEKALLRAAELERSDGELSLDLRISSDAEEIKAAGLGKLVQWKFPDAGREKTQKVERIFEAMDLPPGGRVADVGSGWGFLTFRLARAVGPHGEVWSVDIEDEALDKLRERTARGSYAQVEVVEGKRGSPRLPRGTLDAVVIVNAYHEMTRHRKMLRGIRRSLRPGGRLVIVEPYDPDSRDDPRKDQVKRHHLAPELVESELQAAGFEVLEREDDLVESPKQSLVVARPR